MVNVNVTGLCPGSAVVRGFPCARRGGTCRVGHNICTISFQDEFPMSSVSVVLSLSTMGVVTEYYKCPRMSASEGKDLCCRCRCWWEQRQ